MQAATFLTESERIGLAADRSGILLVSVRSLTTLLTRADFGEYDWLNTTPVFRLYGRIRG
jgi:hypothetical protein